MVFRTTAITSSGVIESKPLQTYGSGDVLLRIGNGGAGATGLIEALANDYLAMKKGSGSIEWICNHSRNTQLALLNDHIDLALTYERDQEDIAALEGWCVTAGCIFHDHFCVVGPLSDPADVRSAATAQEALNRIARKRALFHSRADDSATMWKERSLWSLIKYAPWKDEAASAWYKQSTYGPAEALIQADLSEAYLLTDRSTLLRQTSLSTIHNVTLFIEPTNSQDQLMNSCHALYSLFVSETVSNNVEDFLSYLRSVRGQSVIASFGKSTVGVPLFANVEEGYAASKLAGGRPNGGIWHSA